MGILARAALELGLITWGTFSWYSTAMEHHLAYEHAPQDPVFLITQGTWACMESFPSLEDHWEHCGLARLDLALPTDPRRSGTIRDADPG